MAFLDELRQRARQVAAPLICISAVSYFSYHAIQGERGAMTWLELSKQIEQARTALVLSRGVEQRLGHRVTLMRASGLDRDLLDERARAVLNLAHPDERVVFIPGATPPN